MPVVSNKNPLAPIARAFGVDKPGLVTRTQVNAAVKAAKADGTIDSLEKGALAVLWYQRAGSGYYASEGAKAAYANHVAKGHISTGNVGAVQVADAVRAGEFKPARLQRLVDSFEQATVKDRRDPRLSTTELRDVVKLAKSDRQSPGVVDPDEKALIAELFMHDAVHRYSAPSETTAKYNALVKKGVLEDANEVEGISEALQLLK